MNTILKALFFGFVLFLGTLIVFESSASLWAAAESAPPSTELPMPLGLDYQEGARLYRRDCASCHGVAGDGDGALAETNALLRPRNFREEPFRFLSTQNGVPTQGDLVKTIRRGIPEAGMPPTLQCSPEETETLAEYVWALFQLGSGKGKTPGKVISIPPSIPAGSAVQVEKLFATYCSACHGTDGTAKESPEFPDSLGRLSKPRDLSSGKFHGGDTDTDLYCRIRCGLPGTAMPPFSINQLTDQQVGDLIAFVRKLARD